MTEQTAERDNTFPEAPPWAGITEGRIVHVRKLGETRCTAAQVVRVWPSSNGSINVLLFPDGSNDGYTAVAQDPKHGALYALPWMTSVIHESQAGEQSSTSWHFPERV